MSDIEKLLLAASLGDQECMKEFYNSFLNFNWLVPSRDAAQGVSSLVDYPNDLIGLLGIKSDENTIVPIFSNSEFAFQWAGKDLLLRNLTGLQLINALPTDWWAAVDPGTDHEKELTPWELNQIGKNHPEALEELVADVYEYPQLVSEVEVSELDQSQHGSLVDALIKLGTEISLVDEIYCLERSGTDLEGNLKIEILIGVALVSKESENDELELPDLETLEKIKTTIEQGAKPHLIGSYNCKVYVGIWGLQSITLQIFVNSSPIYKK